MDKRNVVLEQDESMDHLIRVDEIRIKCNFPIGQIKSLSVKECMGTHTVAEIAAGIEVGSLDIDGQEFNS